MTQAGRAVLFAVVPGFLAGLIVSYVWGLLIGIIAGAIFCVGLLFLFALMTAATWGDEKRDAIFREKKE